MIRGGINDYGGKRVWLTVLGEEVNPFAWTIPKPSFSCRLSEGALSKSVQWLKEHGVPDPYSWIAENLPELVRLAGEEAFGAPEKRCRKCGRPMSNTVRSTYCSTSCRMEAIPDGSPMEG
jgi:hypothetical protein